MYVQCVRSLCMYSVSFYVMSSLTYSVLHVMILELEVAQNQWQKLVSLTEIILH